MRDVAGPLVEAMLLRRRPFPRGHDLWVLLDRDGNRRELLAPAGRGALHGLPVLTPLEIRLRPGRGRLPVLDHIEHAPAAGAAVDPARWAFQQWVCELVEAGLQPEDPHPELWSPLAERGAARHRPEPDEWGAAAVFLAQAWGYGRRPNGVRSAVPLPMVDRRRTSPVPTVGRWPAGIPC